jgi:nitrogen fixation NifU-like protein
MTDALQGKTVAEAKSCIAQMMQSLKDGADDFGDAPPVVQALKGVRAFPTRLKCALLAWKAIGDAFQKE